ncbi:hypothetical protein OQA88_4850 [Cercophora sp. LCS_1]
MASQSQPRGYFAGAVDTILGRLSGLPAAASTSYTTTPVRIPLPPSEKGEPLSLAATLYRPTTPNPKGTVLCYGPYGRDALSALAIVRPFASHGYIVLDVSNRGTFGSSGVFLPARNDVADTHAVASWMRTQPWCTGSFAMAGTSYMAFTQWAMLTDPPADMVASAQSLGLYNWAEFVWETGSPRGDFMGWADFVLDQEAVGVFPFVAKVRKLVSNAARMGWLFEQTPLLKAVGEHFGQRAEWVAEVVSRSDPEDAFYAPMRRNEALETVTVPVSLVAGWYDLVLMQGLRVYHRLTERGVKVQMVVGPWTHMNAEGIPKTAYEWIDGHLTKRGQGASDEALEWTAKVHVGGINEWRYLPDWPPATAPLELYLQPNGKLAGAKPEDEGSTESSFVFDPANPTPAVGGAWIDIGSGCVVDSSLAARSDVLTFTTAPLERDVEVMGAPSVSLSHTSDTPFVDLFVRISDVDPKGVSRNICDVYRRLDPHRGQRPVVLNLSPCAPVFRKGNSLRLMIAGGNHPLYHRNPGTAADAVRAEKLRPATHVVRHGKDFVSTLVLPVSRGT